MGAFVTHHFDRQVDDFTKLVAKGRATLPPPKFVEREEGLYQESYGVGTSLWLDRPLGSKCPLILCEVTGGSSPPAAVPRSRWRSWKPSISPPAPGRPRRRCRRDDPARRPRSSADACTPWAARGVPAIPTACSRRSRCTTPRLNRWEALPAMPSPRHGMGAVVVDDRIWVPGGATLQGFGAVATNHVFTPPADRSCF